MKLSNAINFCAVLIVVFACSGVLKLHKKGKLDSEPTDTGAHPTSNFGDESSGAIPVPNNQLDGANNVGTKKNSESDIGTGQTKKHKVPKTGSEGTSGVPNVKPKQQLPIKQSGAAVPDSKADQDKANGAPSDGNTQSDRKDTETEQSRRRILLIGVHGLTKDIETNKLTTTSPHLTEMVGYSAFFQQIYPVFPSMPIPNLVSMATGLYPAHHGVVANNFRDSEKKPFSVEDPVPGLFLGDPIWKALQKDDKKSVACIDWPGCDLGDFDAKYFVKYDNKEKTPRWDQRVQHILDWFSKPSMKLVMVAHSDFIDTVRENGPASNQDVLTQFDDQIGLLVQKLKGAGLYDNLNLIIVGTSGMTMYVEQEEVVLPPQLPLPHTLPTDDFDVWAAEETMWLVQPKPNKFDETIKYFENHNKKKYYDILTKGRRDCTAIPEYWHFEADKKRIPEVIIAAAPGFRLSPNNVRRYKTKAGDGYSIHIWDMKTPLIGHGPAFETAKQKLHSLMAPPDDWMSTVDVHLLLCKILSVRPPDKTDSKDKYFKDIVQAWVLQ